MCADIQNNDKKTPLKLCFFCISTKLLLRKKENHNLEKINKYRSINIIVASSSFQDKKYNISTRYFKVISKCRKHILLSLFIVNYEQRLICIVSKVIENFESRFYDDVCVCVYVLVFFFEKHFLKFDHLA